MLEIKKFLNLKLKAADSRISKNLKGKKARVAASLGRSPMGIRWELSLRQKSLFRKKCNVKTTD